MAGRRRVTSHRSSMPDDSKLARLTYLFVLAGSAAGLATIRLAAPHVQGGTLVLAGVMLIAAMVRLFLPDGRAGMLASRRRLLDVAIFVALGIGLLVAGVLVAAPT